MSYRNIPPTLILLATGYYKEMPLTIVLTAAAYLAGVYLLLAIAKQLVNRAYRARTDAGDGLAGNFDGAVGLLPTSDAGELP